MYRQIGTNDKSSTIKINLNIFQTIVNHLRFVAKNNKADDTEGLM